MSQLVQIKQKIKTTEVIAKVTHTMRLIAMSHHTKLKQLGAYASAYTFHLVKLLQTVHTNANIQPVILLAQQTNSSKQLIILVGSQKGLCGNFNTMILQKSAPFIENPKESTDIITVGKQLHTEFTSHHAIQPVHSFNTVTINTYTTIASELFEYIKTHSKLYHNIIIISMRGKTFFNQKPEQVELFDFFHHSKPLSINQSYQYDEPVDSIIIHLFEQTVIARISLCIHNSLLSEQASRFLSMDNSTRNAKNILETTRLYYNKLRQSKITTQLIELVSMTKKQ